MMSFEVTGEERPDTLQVYLDAGGLRTLLSQLHLLEEKKTDHIHLMAESWGGYDLAELPIEATKLPMRHVKITMR